MTSKKPNSQLSRRTVLRGLAASGAASVFGNPFATQAAFAADPTIHVYPTIVIHLNGGIDTAMHFDARTGLINRNVQAADIRETAAGIRWYQPTLAPIANHMEDCCLVANMVGTLSAGHPQGFAMLWYGTDKLEPARVATPWANYFATELLKRQPAAAPAVMTYRVFGGEQTDFANFNNRSPSALGRAQRITRVADFTQSLTIVDANQPMLDYQSRIFRSVDEANMRSINPVVQPRVHGMLEAANAQASQLFNQQPPPFWPPPEGVREAFNLSDNMLQRVYQPQNYQHLSCQLALAYQLVAHKLSHIIFTVSLSGYDSHEQNDKRQRSASKTTMDSVGRLLTALKATPSPLAANLSMFDTTNVVLATEVGRANARDTEVVDGAALDGTGTPHWAWTQYACFGGVFKRGYKFGAFDNGLTGIKADPVTGQLNSGIVTTPNNIWATLMKANGVNPTGWTNATPLDAIVKG